MSDRLLAVISLHQPWAGWVMLGWKEIETRLHARFACLKGRRIGIHSTNKYDGMALREGGRWLSEEQRKSTGIGTIFDSGRLLGTVYVWDAGWLSYEHSPRAMISSGGRFGLMLTEPHVLEGGYPVRGHQGIWYIDPKKIPGLLTIDSGGEKY